VVSRSAGIVLRGVTVLGIAVGLTGFLVVRASAAQQVALNLTYTCDFPEIGEQSASVTVESSIPDSIAVGQSSAHYAVTASATVPLTLDVGLHDLFGVSTITGTADGQTSVEAPQGDIAETVPFDIQEITLPAFSSFTGYATGIAPLATFSKPGNAEIIVGNLTLHLIPRNSSGGLTSLGEPNVPCTLNSGQNDVAASFTITAAADPTPPNSATGSSDPASTTTAPSPSASTISTSPSPSSSPSPSASKSASVTPTTASPSQSVDPPDPDPSNGGGTAWAVWLGGLAALVAISTAGFRYAPRLWRRWLGSRT
jgi:hypothetical protein